MQKKSISSRQLARDLNFPVKTAYSLCQRIRKAMLGQTSPLLQGIIEMDETYIGGKPRYRSNTNKRGRGTSKQMVVGLAQRKGNVIATPINNYNQKKVRSLLLENVDIDNAIVNTDEYKAYDKVHKITSHSKINHGSKEYVKGTTHTNTIEGFWSLLKRAYYGQHHHYSKKYMDLYVGEAMYKYNLRKETPEQVFNNIVHKVLYV